MTYMTVQGDTWDGISFSLFGTEEYMSVLMEANPKHSNTVVFGANVVLNIPEITQPAAATLPPWK